MNSERPEGVRDDAAHAGGWGATRALARALAREQIVVQGTRTLLKANQPDGFDCPGCAWPDPKSTSSFEFCENGAKAVAWESTAKRVGPDFFAEHTVASLRARSDHWLEAQGRLTHPMRYDPASDRFLPVDWDAACAEIGRRLNALPSPDAAEFYTSGRASNEAAFLYQLYARRFGTNNFPDCSNLCHEATSVGLPQVLGVGKATVTLEDYEHADLILSWGHNPGTNHPRMMATLCDAARRGARIIVFNPLREVALERFASPQSPREMATGGATPIATRYLQPRIGGDAAAIRGLMKALIARDDARRPDDPPVLDRAFIAEHTDGFDAFADELRAAEWAAIERASGLARAELEEVAALYAGSRAAIVCYGMGITQHCHGTANVQLLANLLMLRGNIGRPGAGMSPLRGHSNVQGDRTVGIDERPKPEFLDRLGRVFGFEPPRRHGHSVVDAIAAMRDGRSKAIVCLGGNLAVAASDPAACAEAFGRVDLAVHVMTKLARSPLLSTGGACFLLPCLGRTELDLQATGRQAITVEDSMSMVHASSGFLAPAGVQVRSEPWIVAGLAKATLAPDPALDWDALAGDYALIRDRIEAVLPDFAGYNERIRTPGGFQLPNAAQRRVWNTPTGRARFVVFHGLEQATGPRPGVLTMTTLRSHDQYNTTIYGLDDRYRGIFGRRDVLFVGPRELARLGFREGDRVDVRTAGADAHPTRVVRNLTLVRRELPDGGCASYFPETQALVALSHHDPESRTPAFKSVPVTIERAEDRTPGSDDGRATGRPAAASAPADREARRVDPQ